MRHRRSTAVLACAVLGAALLAGCAAAPSGGGAQVAPVPVASAPPTSAPTPPAPASARPTAPRTTAPTAAAPTAAPRTTAPSRVPAGRVLLFPRSGGDGDSWRDRAGVSYRLGLVNTPELDECFGREASAERKRLTAAGFRAQSYAVDDFDRRVSVVTLADGRDLNVLLAREGWADDRFLSRFRDENPALAARLDVAFAAAKRERAGLWGACAGATTAAPAAPVPLVGSRAGCEPAYPTVCVPPGPDLDCGDVPARRFPVLAPDPHRFDGNGDGVGCEGPPG